MRYADIIIDISHESVDRPFQYRVPENLQDAVYPGVCVHVRFGRGNRERTGYVIALSDTPSYPEEKIKDILSVEEKSTAVEGRLIRTACWMRSHYGSTTINALKTVLPVRTKNKPLMVKKVVRTCSKSETEEACKEARRKHQVAKVRMLEALTSDECLPYTLVRDKLHVSAETLKSLEKQGLLTVQEERHFRNPVAKNVSADAALTLSDEQQFIIRDFMADFHAGKCGVCLLQGITGSGKTEVYLGLIEEMLALGRQAILLIPEIALTYQTLLRVYKRFGDRVSVLHSGLSAGERSDQMERAKTGDIDVMIGPRSALFAPFPNLGLIIIDEEHEPSYKNENMPRYHVRETAIQMAKDAGASVLLGSATPSLEASYRARAGEYKLYHLTKRLTGGTLPDVEIADLREELRAGNRSIFSRRLQKLLREKLAAGEQSMLFLNRRGYSGFISCRACGEVIKCPHCDVSLSLHRNGRLVCHYCGYEQEKPARCPSCGSEYISGFRVGTEQVEEAVHRMFPEARVLRMDADSTRKKDSYEQILSSFADGEADILVGTQMIVKGHDFPNVTLVGILAADLSLNQNDYRAGERTFQLLTQAAGRAGRGDKPGQVVIQTYQPDHYAVRFAAAQDYEGFYAEEILYRSLLQYPPVAHMLMVLLVTKTEERGDALAEELAAQISGGKAEQEGWMLIGPARAGIAKINDLYRNVLYIKHQDYEALVRAKDILEAYWQNKSIRDANILFDFDPVSPA